MRPIKKNIHITITIILFTFCQLLLACQRHEPHEALIVIGDFPQVINLQGYSLNHIRNDMNPLQMGLHDDLLVLNDWGNSPHFHVYQLPDFAYLGSFGTEGRGPGEFQDPVFWGQFAHSDSTKAWIYQMNTKVLSIAHVGNSLNNPNYQHEIRHTLPAESNEIVNVLVFNEDTILGSGVTAEGEFFRFYPLLQSWEWIDYRIHYTTKLSSFYQQNTEHIPILKQGVVKAKPDQTRFVKALVYSPIIDIYHINGDLDFSIVLKNAPLPLFHKGAFNPQTKAWYENIFLSDNHIYALNRNCTIAQYVAGDCRDVEIHVFNWQGQAVLKYRLQDGIAPAAPFVVDEKNKRIYTIHYKENGDFFLVYDLSRS